MTIQMKPHEPIRVMTSLRVSDRDILRFLAAKKKWIQKNVENFQKIPVPPVRTASPGEQWMYLGEKVEVRDALTVLAKPFVKWTPEAVMIFWPESLWAKRHEHRPSALIWLEKSLRLEAEALISKRVHHYSHEMGLFPSKLKFMQARTRWGSCSSRGSLNFHWKLIGAPLEVIDSIVVHEIAHLKHLNHSDKFWELVEKHAPQHSEADRWLREHQHLL
jgi:hypothetical protein